MLSSCYPYHTDRYKSPVSQLMRWAHKGCTQKTNPNWTPYSILFFILFPMGFSSGSWFQRCIVCHHDIGILKQFDVALGWVFSPKHDEKGLQQPQSLDVGLPLWLVVWNHGILWLSRYWECHHPNWRTPSFFRGVGQPPTSTCHIIHCMSSHSSNPLPLRENVSQKSMV